MKNFAVIERYDDCCNSCYVSGKFDTKGEALSFILNFYFDGNENEMDSYDDSKIVIIERGSSSWDAMEKAESFGELLDYRKLEIKK